MKICNHCNKPIEKCDHCKTPFLEADKIHCLNNGEHHFCSEYCLIKYCEDLDYLADAVEIKPQEQYKTKEIEDYWKK